MKIENNPTISTIEIPTQEEKFSERLKVIDVTKNNALEEVKFAIEHNFNWSREEFIKYNGLIDSIIGAFNEIKILPKQENPIFLYSDIQGYITQLPNISGLRQKVKEITTIPELESELVS